MAVEGFKRVLKEAPQTEIPTRIRQIQRIVHHIGIPVVALQAAGGLDEGIRTHHPAHQRVIHAPVHVDEAHLVQVLVFGVAAVGGLAYQAVGYVGLAIDVAPLAPGVKG